MQAFRQSYLPVQGRIEVKLEDVPKEIIDKMLEGKVMPLMDVKLSGLMIDNGVVISTGGDEGFDTTLTFDFVAARVEIEEVK